MPVIAGLALALTASLSGIAGAQGAPAMPASQTVQEYVSSYFAAEPVMTDIARCESRFTQFNKDGSVVKNPNSSATGVFQIMASVHAGAAKDNLGLDIYTLQGNAAYADYLYHSQGTAPWNDSKACWGKSAAAKALAVASNK